MRRKLSFGARKGNTMIEASFCLILFMTIFMAIMEFGWGMYNFNFVSYAAREGARYASTRGSQCQGGCTQATEEMIRSLVRGQAVVIDASQIAVTMAMTPNSTPGNMVTVNVSYPIPVLLGWLMGSNTITATSSMRIAQ
jgi:Flp pilus assembly protein TadG